MKRHFKAGEIICREGEFGSTAFYILEGKAEVFLSSPIAHVKTEGSSKGFFSKLQSLLTPRERRSPRARNPNGPSFPSTRSVDLPYDNPIAELEPGDLFGEMTCMSYYPRSATVRAKTDCVMLEMLRNVLDILQRNKTFRAQLERNYRTRALDSHLRSIPVFVRSPRTSSTICAIASNYCASIPGRSFAAREIPPTASIWSASAS